MAIQALNAQSFSFGVATGVSLYNGDLSHHNQLYSDQEFNWANSLSFGYKISDSWNIGISYLNTTIEGNDALSKSEDFVSRNLSFHSRINEISVYGQYHFFNTFSISTKYFSPYLFGGVGVFKFDPKADYEGNTYSLQPLSTEGQGLPGTNLMPYQLIETNIQLGFGININLTQKISLSLNSTLRLTSTDYLDDVSGTYYDINQLSIYKGGIAAKMAYRSAELSNDLPESLAGLKRGNAANNDSYIVHMLSLNYFF